MITILLAVLAAATNACASVLQRKANVMEVEAQRSGLASLLDLVRQPVWLGGIAAVIVSFLLQAGALGTGELSEVQPLMSMELPMALALGSVVFRQGLGRRTWIAIGIMTAGMAVFLFALHPSGGARSVPDGLEWSFGAGVTAGIVAVLTIAAVLVRGEGRAALLGVASGIAFALTAVFIDAVLTAGLSLEVLTHWQTYMVAVAGLSAMILLQEGLQAGRLVAVQPGVTLSDPVVAIVLGVVLFDERVRTGGWLIVEVLGALAVGWGALELSRSAAAEAALALHEQPEDGPADDRPVDRPPADRPPVEHRPPPAATQAPGRSTSAPATSAPADACGRG